MSDYKESVRAATTDNIDLNAPGSSIDDVVLSSGNRILLMGQSAGRENGIYVWGGESHPLRRASDANSSGKLSPGFLVPVEEGTENGNKVFELLTNAPVVVDVTHLSFGQVGALGPGSNVVTLGTNQTIAGDKTFTGESSFNGDVALNGSTLDASGGILLVPDPVDGNNAASKDYVDTEVSGITPGADPAGSESITGAWTWANNNPILVGTGSASITGTGGGYLTLSTPSGQLTLDSSGGALNLNSPGSGISVQGQVTTDNDLIVGGHIEALSDTETSTFVTDDTLPAVSVTKTGDSFPGVNIWRNGFELGDGTADPATQGTLIYSGANTLIFSNASGDIDINASGGDLILNANGDTIFQQTATFNQPVDFNGIVGFDNTVNINNFALNMLTNAYVSFDEASSGNSIVISKQTGDAESRFDMKASGSLNWGSGAAVPDTNLYRSAANMLKTDDGLTTVGTIYANGGLESDGALGGYIYVYGGGDVYVQTALPSSQAFAGQAAGDTNDRFKLQGDGTFNWGSGSAAPDTDLFRFAAGELKTNGALRVDDFLVVGTNATICGSPTDTLAFYGEAGQVQAANIPNPTGGATIDAETRTAIDSILAVLEGLGLTS